MVVQSYTPEHYAIQAASRHDYDGFFTEEIDFRRQHRYPPFVRLARYLYRNRNDAACAKAADQMARKLARHARERGCPWICSARPGLRLTGARRIPVAGRSPVARSRVAAGWNPGRSGLDRRYRPAELALAGWHEIRVMKSVSCAVDAEPGMPANGRR